MGAGTSIAIEQSGLDHFAGSVLVLCVFVSASPPGAQHIWMREAGIPYRPRDSLSMDRTRIHRPCEISLTFVEHALLHRCGDTEAHATARLRPLNR